MKFYNSVGPNPQVVRMFAAEKGVDLLKDCEVEEVDIVAGANREAAFLAKNPGGQSPCIETDDGEFLAEITALCEYIDEKFPGPSLMGETPEARAANRMWARRVDLNVCEPLANGFRYSEGKPMFENRMTLLPEAADGLKRLAQEKVSWLDGLMEGREFVSGDKVGLADVLLYSFLSFGASVGQPLNEDNKNIMGWFERMKARPSANA